MAIGRRALDANAGTHREVPPAGKGRSIGFWLRWLVVACIVPAWGAAAFLIADSYQRQRMAIDAGTVATARALLQAVDDELLSVQAALQALATSHALVADDLAAFYAQAREVQRQRNAINLVLARASGQQLINTLRPFGAPLPETAAPGKLPLVFSEGVPVVSDLFVGPVTQQPIIAVMAPVVSDGRVAYVLGMNMLPERFAELLRRQKPPPSWVIAILDTTGTIVARTANPDRFVGRKAAAPLRRRMTEVAEGSLELPTLEGTPVVAAFSRSSVSGWTVAIGVPTADLTAELRRSLGLSIAAAGALLLLGAVSAHVLSDHIARSIRTLSASALDLASGRVSSVPPTSISEVSEVGEALVRASHQLLQREVDRAKAAEAQHQAAIAERVAAKFRGLLEAAPDAMIVVRPDGTISFANGHAETIFGYSQAVLLGRPINWLIPDRFHASHDAHMKAFFAAPDFRPMGAERVLFGRRRDGTEFPVEISLSPIESEGEACVMAAMRDVTERKHLETSVETSRMQMVDSARLSALGAMAGGIAHEINNPLAVVHALAKDLVEAAEHDGASTPASVAPTARQIVAHAERIARIVKSMRHLARDGATDPFDEAAVGDIVGQVLDLCAEGFRNRSVALSTSPIDPTLRIKCRAVQIAQVLANLLQNALDAVEGLPGDKWVRVEVAALTDDVVLSVTDCGHGVPPALKARIMEPFFTTKAVGKGTGLGLSLSKQIAEAHGGALEVDENDGHTRFSLRLPRSGPGSPACS
ncbi:MAG TPA: PAS domain S-box protein [Candidatus Sulfotelmatobacter sp.]|nr:PAS domain S-box protein [Candidatus Sulfotelmatobacter sp.]